MSNDDLDVAKQQLLDKLGPNYSSYIQILGKWFRGIISKEEFDKSAKLLNEQSFVLEHNKFWLTFFRHCANNSAENNNHHHNNNQNQNHHHNHNHNHNHHHHHHHNQQIDGYHRFDNSLGTRHNQLYNDSARTGDSASDQAQTKTILNDTTKVRCLPSKVITRMRIFVIAWEIGLDSASDQVSAYINLALQYFLKNIITELICTKTAYRLRENKFKYAIGVKPMNPYLNNSLRVYTNNLEYDPYQIESNKMNSSLLDTCIYNDTLFPSRLYEAQALYEYACSTTSVSQSPNRRPTKRVKLLSDIFLNHDDEFTTTPNLRRIESSEPTESPESPDEKQVIAHSDRRLTLYHLMIAFLSNRTVIPSQSLYSINLERIFTKLSC